MELDYILEVLGCYYVLVIAGPVNNGHELHFLERKLINLVAIFLGLTVDWRPRFLLIIELLRE